MNTRKALFLTIALTLAAGTLLRLFPIAAGQPRLSDYFMTEDGYLMLTVARNMAIGLGMSVSEGTIPTNGVQPMATYLFALPYWLTGGDKTASLIGVTLISVLWSVAGIFAVRAYARQALGPRGEETAWPWLVAGLWFIGPLLLRHTMNALETGLYALFVLLALLAFSRILDRGDKAAWPQVLGFGALCGLVFLARNDGAFLVIAIFFCWLLHELLVLRRGLVASAGRLFASGVVCLVVAGPWMIHNKINFGSIVPVSGSAQSFGAELGQNLPMVPVKLFEHAFPMLPVPTALESSPAIIAICAVALLAVGAIYIGQALKFSRPTRFMLLAYALYGVMLCGYYGLFFGAPHFLSRYLMPLSPLLIVAVLSVALMLAGRLMPRQSIPAVALAGCGALLLSLALLARQLLPHGHDQGHFQVVHWVQDNVPAETWVGAVQTGTLGYWHDRTINLDGKVNPQALHALQNRGHVLDYVVQSEIDVIADWSGIAGWPQHEDSDFAQYFEVIVDDKDSNLGVLRRKPD